MAGHHLGIGAEVPAQHADRLVHVRHRGRSRRRPPAPGPRRCLPRGAPCPTCRHWTGDVPSTRCPASGLTGCRRTPAPSAVERCRPPGRRRAGSGSRPVVGWRRVRRRLDPATPSTPTSVLPRKITLPVRVLDSVRAVEEVSPLLGTPTMNNCPTCSRRLSSPTSASQEAGAAVLGPAEPETDDEGVGLAAAALGEAGGADGDAGGELGLTSPRSSASSRRRRSGHLRNPTAPVRRARSRRARSGRHETTYGLRSQRACRAGAIGPAHATARRRDLRPGRNRTQSPRPPPIEESGRSRRRHWIRHARTSRRQAGHHGLSGSTPSDPSPAGRGGRTTEDGGRADV